MSSDFDPSTLPPVGKGAARRAARKQPKSTYELLFGEQLRTMKLEYAREYLFHPDRNWRADFFIPSLLLLIEIEGVSPTGTRHQRIGGFRLDIEKYAEAVCMGYRLLRVLPEQVTTGKAVEYLTRIISAPEHGPGQRKAAFERWWKIVEKKS